MWTSHKRESRYSINDLSFHIGLHGKIVSTTDQVLGWYRVVEDRGAGIT